MKKNNKDPKIKTKIIIRSLPPQLTEEQFKNIIEKYLEFIEYLFYYPGKIT